MDIQTVNVRLEELLTNLKRLLSANDGCLLLARALSSYETAFSPISVASDAGVSFEHLRSILWWRFKLKLKLMFILQSNFIRMNRNFDCNFYILWWRLKLKLKFIYSIEDEL